MLTRTQVEKLEYKTARNSMRQLELDMLVEVRRAERLALKKDTRKLMIMGIVTLMIVVVYYTVLN